MSHAEEFELLTGTFTETEAEVIRCLLEANGIVAQVASDRAFPSVEGVAGEKGVRVRVPAGKHDEAVHILDQARAEAATDDGEDGE
jgi:putative signal transducing protein